jgi:LacI family transcriptional regulator
LWRLVGVSFSRDEVEKMPTLLDVAKVAGVGVMSVSRVVNGTRKVSKKTEEKVRSAIARIGYEPNEAARILKGQRARVLGLIVPELADPFFATCANAIQEAAREGGYMTLMVASGHRASVERQQAELMMQRQIAGLIIIPSGLENDYLLKAKGNGLPIVSLDRPLDNVDTDAVLVDNRDASIKAVEHILNHGHRQVLCIIDEYRIFTKQERLAGYIQAMRNAKLTTMVCTVGPTSGSVAAQLSPLLASESKPTAIFVASDLLTIETLQYLQQANVRIPNDIALVCFDDFDAATLVTPQITAIRQPVAELGRKAVSLLLERLSGVDTKSWERVVLSTELIIRGSCGCGNANSTIKPDTTATGRRSSRGKAMRR